MKLETFFLKVVIIIIGIPVLALCILVIPHTGSVSEELLPNIPFIKYLIPFGFWLSSVFYYLTLYQAFNLLRYIDTNTAFSTLSIISLKKNQALRYYY